MNEVNLLKHTGGVPAIVSQLDSKFRIISWWSLITLLVFGIIIGASYVVLNSNIARLELENRQLTQQIDTQSVKEGIILSLRQRIDVAQKALSAARPWGNLFPLLTQITYDKELTSLVVDEAGKVSITFHLASITDAVRVVTNTVALENQKSLRLPQLVSFSITDDGSVLMSISFVPAL